jgi:hypothetical protein
LLYPLFVPVPEACKMFGCGKTTFYTYVNTGKIHLVHHGRKSVVSVAEICELAAQLARDAGISVDPAAALRAYDGPENLVLSGSGS